MAHKNILFPVLIAGLIGLIIIGGSFMLSPYNTEDTINGQKENPVEESENPVETYTSTFGELKSVGKPDFKVGEKYFYHYWEKRPDTAKNIDLPVEYDTTVEVKAVERINKSNYYLLESKNVSVYPSGLKKDKNGVWKKRHVEAEISICNETGCKRIITGEVVPYEGCTIGINEENGKIEDAIPILSMCLITYRMFSEWMLYLDKGVKWTEKMNMSLEGLNDQYEEEWEVKDIEKVNGRDCFKVVQLTKTELTSGKGKRISGEVFIYWVDTKKRILVKMERKEDNILIEAIELTNYET